MALNPPVLPGGLPMGIVGELYCLQRGGIDFELTGALPSKLKASGTLYLTTVRICFVPDHPTPAFAGIDIPLQGISKESFEQPWFGANYLKGDVAPVPGRGLMAPGTFKMHFMKGGCTKFLSFFFSIMERWKVADERARHAFFESQPAVQAFIVESQTAFVDPSDPSVIYVTQPAAVQAAARIPRQEWYPTPVGAVGRAPAPMPGPAPAPVPGGYAGFGGPMPAPAPAPGMPAYGAPAPGYGGGGPAPAAYGGPGGYPPAGPAPGYGAPPPGYAAAPAPGGSYAPAPAGYGPPPGVAPGGGYAYGAPAGGPPPGYAAAPYPGGAPGMMAPAAYAPVHAGGAAGTSVVTAAATAAPRFF